MDLDFSYLGSVDNNWLLLSCHTIEEACISIGNLVVVDLSAFSS